MTRPDGLEFKASTLTPALESQLKAAGEYNRAMTPGGWREPDATGVIEALVAVTGVEDEVGDVIEPGAFRRTLAERPKPKACLGHDWNRPIGKTLDIKELMPGDSRLPKKTADGRPWPREAGALWTRFLVNLDSDDGRNAFSSAKFYGGEQSTFSIGYRTVRARQRGSTRYIQDLDLFEYGPVLNPANRLATLQSIKADGELTSPVDSERQDFEAGNGDVETKTKYVRDANYWGKPLGTPITPGMKPRGGGDPNHGVSEMPQRGNSVFSGLPDDEQAFARSLPTEQRMDYLERRAKGESHEDAAAAVKPKPAPKRPADDELTTATTPWDGPANAEPGKPTGRKIPPPPVDDAKPAPKKPAAPKKPTAKQTALLFEARPGRIMTYRRDDNGNRIYGGPFPNKEGLIFRGHANSAFPMEKAGWVEAGYDGRHYILTPEGERLRAQLESEDADRQNQLREERRAAALGPDTVASADANVDVNAAPMDMTSRQYADAQMAAQARRKRAVNIVAEEATAGREADQASAADKAATLAPGAIDIDTYRRRTNNPKAELAANGRMVLTGAGTRNWSLSTVDGLGVIRSIDFNEFGPGGDRRKPLGKTQLRDLANRLAAIRDSQGRPVPFDYPNPDPDRSTPEWIRGWRDVTGADLQSAINDVVTQWAGDNDLTYRRVGPVRKQTQTVPGGAPDSAGFRMRKAEELAPGDQVRLPDGGVGTVERSGADVWNSDWRDAKKIDGQVLLDDGRTIGIRELAGLEKPEPPKIGTGPNALSDAHVARKRGGGDGPAARDMIIPIKFAADADSPDAGHDPGMGSIPATATPPGREIDFSQLVYSNYVPSVAKTYEPLPAGTRVVQNGQETDRFLPRDGRAKVGTALPLLADFNGETFQTVRLDDGSYDQWRVRGVHGSSGSEGAFEVDPSPERIDQVRRERGLPPVADSTPLQRDAEPEPVDVQEVSTPGKTVQEVSTPPTPEPAPFTPPAVTPAELPPEREALPYEVIKRPNRSGKGARVRYNGHEYSVDATSGVLAEVTVTDDDGHSATVAGGSSTMLRREQLADRERAVREALSRAEAQHNAASESTPEPVPEPSGTETEPPAPPVVEAPAPIVEAPAPIVEPESDTATIPAEQVDEAAVLQDEVLGITEQPDGTIEVSEEVADRQDRVAALIEQDEAGTLDLSGRSDAELANTRQDLSDELRLQSVLATRQATPRPEIVTSPAGAAEKPPQRPGLAGAAEDYSEALQSGDAEAVARTRARLESSLRRSRAGSQSARELADHISGEDDDDAERLISFAQTLRRETRERRNTAARKRRTARRLERVRIQSLIDKIDSELQTRARSTESPTSRSSADQLAANYEQMHGTAGVRKQVDRLRNQNRLSARDQELLAALESRLTSRDNSANVAGMSTDAPRPKANADRPRAERSERVTHQPGDRVVSEYGQGTVIEQTGRSLRYRLDSGEELNIVVGTPGYDRVRPLGESAAAAIVDEKWAGKDWRQALRDMPREERTELADKVGAHRYKVYADQRAKGEPHAVALKAASGEDDNGPSLFAGKQSLERVAAERDGIDPTLRSADVFLELGHRKQRLATGRKPLAFENVDSESYRKRVADLEIPVTILTALAEQERALTSTSRESNNAFTDNPARMSPARLRAQIFALERSQNALDQKRLAQLRRAADKRGISPIAGQAVTSEA